METDRKKRSAWPTIFVGVVVLASAYAGAYGLLMDPYPLQWHSGHRPNYPHRTLDRLFGPAHWVDRNLIRPDFWDPWADGWE